MPFRGPTTLVTEEMRAPMAAVFDYSAALDTLPEFLERYGPIPPIVSTTALHPPWGRVGADRHVFMKDGGRVREELTHHERPRYFAYNMGDYHQTPLKLLAKRAWSSWTLSEHEGVTRVEWLYVFEKRSWLTAPLLSGFVHWLYRAWMAQSLRKMKALLESRAGDGAGPVVPVVRSE